MFDVGNSLINIIDKCRQWTDRQTDGLIETESQIDRHIQRQTDKRDGQTNK